MPKTIHLPVKLVEWDTAKRALRTAITLRYVFIQKRGGIHFQRNEKRTERERSICFKQVIWYDRIHHNNGWSIQRSQSSQLLLHFVRPFFSALQSRHVCMEALCVPIKLCVSLMGVACVCALTTRNCQEFNQCNQVSRLHVSFKN